MKVWTNLVADTTYDNLKVVVGPDSCSKMKDTKDVAIVFKRSGDIAGELKITLTPKEAVILSESLVYYMEAHEISPDEDKMNDSDVVAIRNEISNIYQRLNTLQVMTENCVAELSGMRKRLRSIGETL